ncbi:unnamed protein product, partial [Symbiodinium necroappetens]
IYIADQFTCSRGQSSPSCADPAYQKVDAKTSTAAAQPLASDGTAEDLVGSPPIETTLESFVWVEEDMPEVDDGFQPDADKSMKHLIHQEKEIFQFDPVQEYDETLTTAESSAQMPWIRFLVFPGSCSLASGTLSSQSIFVQLASTKSTVDSVHKVKIEDTDVFCFFPCHLIGGMNARDSGASGVCQSIAYGFSAPIGLMYDLWGAKKTGTTGALSCAVGLLLACGSVFGAASGHAIGLHADLCINSLKSGMFMLYQASAALPLLLQAGMKWLELRLHFVMLAWAAAVFAAAGVCSVVLPTQIEFLEQAKHVLGVPLPKPGGTGVPEMISRAVGIVRVHLTDHLVSGLALASALVLPALYSSLAAPYAELLFGHESDGKMLVKINVVGSAVAGLLLAPLAGMLADGFGLEAFTVLLAASALVALVTVGIASWPAQALCTSSAVLFTSCFSTYVWRYTLLYSPPSRFGTVQGIFSTALIIVSTPLSVAGMAAISLRPPGLNEYRVSMLACGLMGAVLMAHYVAYVRRYPPPDCPTMLPEDEAMLAKSFGCGNLDEVCEVTRVRRKSILIKKMGSNRSEDFDCCWIQDLLSLLAGMDVHKLFSPLAIFPFTQAFGRDDAGASNGLFNDHLTLRWEGEGSERPQDSFVEGLSTYTWHLAIEAEMKHDWPGLKDAKVKGALAQGKLDVMGTCKLAAPQRKAGKALNLGGPSQCPMLSVSFPGSRAVVNLLRAKRPVEDIAASWLHSQHPRSWSGGLALGVLEAMMEQEEVEEKHPGPEASITESSSVAEPQAGIRDRARYLARLVAAADAQAVREYLLTEPLEDIWRVWLDFEKWQAPPERRKMDKDFNNVIPSKDLADILRRRPDLKTFVQSVIVQAVERKIATLRSKQK